jgi:hypothetical protein
LALATLLAASPAGDAFWRQALLNAVSPLVAALVGGWAVGLIVRRAQDRRENRTLRNTLGFEMIQVAYAFYRRTTEAIRTQRYEIRNAASGQPSADESLAQQYREFRIAGQVLESKLEAYFHDGEARWLWHGVVDLLGVRYYQVAGGGPPLDDMIARHAGHPDDEKIPDRVRQLFLKEEFLRNDKVVRERFEKMLREAIQLLLERKIPAERLTR